MSEIWSRHELHSYSFNKWPLSVTLILSHTRGFMPSVYRLNAVSFVHIFYRMWMIWSEHKNVTDKQAVDMLQRSVHRLGFTSTELSVKQLNISWHIKSAPRHSKATFTCLETFSSSVMLVLSFIIWSKCKALLKFAYENIVLNVNTYFRRFEFQWMAISMYYVECRSSFRRYQLLPTQRKIRMVNVGAFVKQRYMYAKN